MSAQLPTVIRYHADPIEERKLEIKCERLKENNRRESIKRRPLVAKQAQSDCGNIRNPWCLRCGVAFVALVFAVIFVALYSKMHAKMEDIEVKLAHFESLLATLEERIHCSVIRINGTDRRGGSCSQHVGNASYRVKPTKKVRTTITKKQTTSAPPRRRTDSVDSDWTIRKNLNAVYVAWGVTRCPERSPTLYSGTVASSDASAFLCLPNNFQYENPKNISNADRVQLHPVRYGNSMGLFEPKWNRAKNYARDDSDVPCAVCRHTGRSAVLVKPAASNCPTGKWQREYRGYLMTSERQQKRTEFICVNIYAESKPAQYGRLHVPGSRLQLTQYGYEPAPANRRHSALACVVCLI